MRIETIEQAQEIDSISQKVYKLPGELLMESAGSGAAREIDQAYYPELKSGMTAVICGPGNNGGDGLVLARHLHSMGHRDITVYTLAAVEKQSVLFKAQLERVELQGLRVIDLLAEPQKSAQFNSAKLVVDAVFGIGLRSDVESPYSDIIDRINGTKVPVVSLDCPSGLNCNSGVVCRAAVRANMTVTFGLAKPGFFVCEGPLHVGRLRILSIGFPYEVLRQVATTHFAFNEKLARRYLPKRKQTSKKTDHGHLLVYAGHQGTWGAGVLCASSAYRMGTGYVTLASFTDPKEIVGQHPEMLTTTVKESMSWDKKISAFAVGPGLGVSKETADLIQWLRDNQCERVVLDADALTTCVQFDLFPLPESWVLTPHSGELARILKMEARAIDADRFSAAQKAFEVTGCHVLLKGFRSVLAFEGRCMVILAGNSALAKAGTGDVLTGMIGGLLAQGLPTLQATATAAYIHGRIADEWVRVGNDKRTMTAGDLRDHLPNLMGRLAGGALSSGALF